MLFIGPIQPGQTKWAFQIIFVTKADESPWFCVDYRKLKAVTIRHSYPILCWDEFFDWLCDATILQMVDANSRVGQVKRSEDDQEKTAFRSPHGLYRFKACTFVLKCPRNVSMPFAHPNNYGLMAVCPDLFGWYQKFYSNARQTDQPFPTRTGFFKQCQLWLGIRINASFSQTASIMSGKLFAKGAAKSLQGQLNQLGNLDIRLACKDYDPFLACWTCNAVS